MRVTLLVLMIALFSLPIIGATPSIYVNYAEIMEYDGHTWRSSYMQISGNSLSMTTSSRIIIVRNDASSGKQPFQVLIDGLKYSPVQGGGVLWNAAVIILDGGVHKVDVVFRDIRARLPVTALFMINGGSTTMPINVSVPKVPGYYSLGIKVVLLLRGGDAGNVVDKPLFVLNQTSISILGERLSVVEAIVPFENVSLKGDFIKATYSYIYGLEQGFSAPMQLPPYPEKFIYVNTPVLINTTTFTNLITGNPPKLLLSTLNGSQILLKTIGYTVTYNVASPSSLCGLSDTSFRVISARQSPGGIENKVTVPPDNTTLIFRFFSRGLSLVDVIVTTPPPRVTVTPPIYTLSFTLYDKMGGKVSNAYYTVYSEGRIISSGIAKNGEGQVCPLPPGEYIIVVYLANNVIARETIQIGGDSYLPIITNTTTVRVTLLREGTGDLLNNYTLVLENSMLSYNSSSRYGRTTIEGVIPGNYTFSVYISRDKIYEGTVYVTDTQNTFVFSLPVYQLKLQLLGALNQPLANIEIIVEGKGIKRALVTDARGQAFAGFLPQGQYHVLVGDKEFNLTLSADSFRTLTLDIVAIVDGYTVTTSHLEFLLLVALIIMIVLAVRRLVKSFKTESPHIIEV